MPRAELDPSDWRLADEASAFIFAAPELAPTLRAVADAFVPQHARAALIALDDEHGVARVAAGSHRDASRTAALSAANGRRLEATAFLASPGCRTETFPLARRGKQFGRLLLLIDDDSPPQRGALLHLLAERAAQALDNARRFERERNVALTFQDAALVAELPDVPGYRFDAIYRAGRLEALVGGDWYDAFPLGDGRAVISIGDVVGSGLQAAVAMVSVRQTIRGVAQVNPDPAVMLQAAEATLRSQFPDRYVTAFAAVLDPVTQSCSYANAGHPAPFVRYADGTLHQPQGRNAPLGLGLQQRIDVHHMSLPPGALFVLYTDGLTESTKNVIEGEARLESVLRAEPARGPGVARRIHDEVLGGQSRDDVAVLTVAVEESLPARRWRFDPMWKDASRRVRDELRAELSAAGFAEERLFDAEVILSEVIGNALRYAPGTIDLMLVRRNDRAVLHVLDLGPGFQFSARLPFDLYSEFGRGLFLISQLAFDFSVERRPGGGSHARIVLT
ncbi:MAG TPA: SpoIIE family protein phosphatase [Candidatus Elarobacter sp.]